MSTLTDIEQLTESYAIERDALAALVVEMNEAMEGVKRERLAAIKAAVKSAREAKDKLKIAIVGAGGLFEKPRTRVMHGIKVGFTKQRGSVVFDDEEKVIERIRKQLPKEQVELLIRTKESVHKPAVYDLVANDLKRLGIRITDDCDAVVIKSVDSEVDKLVSALLSEEEQEVMEEAA